MIVQAWRNDLCLVDKKQGLILIPIGQDLNYHQAKTILERHWCNKLEQQHKLNVFKLSTRLVRGEIFI